MHLPQVHYPAVLAGGVLIFVLGGLWYSPVLFAKKWIALIGKTEEELKAGSGAAPVLFVFAFLCGLLASWGMAVVLNHFAPVDVSRGALVGLFCWVGFTGPSSFANAIFSMKPKALWAIDSGYNLVSFVLAGMLLSIWK